MILPIRPRVLALELVEDPKDGPYTTVIKKKHMNTPKQSIFTLDKTNSYHVIDYILMEKK